MKLKYIHLRYAPGLPNGLPKVTIGDGLTFIVGPNASGKSTLARTMRLAFWTVSDPPSIDASVRVLRVTGQELSTEIQSGLPLTPLRKTTMAAGTHTLYKLGLAQLLRGENETDKAFAARLQTELHGGVPIAQIREEIREAQKRHRAPRKALDNARQRVQKAEHRNYALLADQKTLQRLQEERKRAEASRDTVQAIDTLLRVLDAQSERNALQIELSVLPIELERLRSDDVDVKRALEARQKEARRSRDAHDAAHEELLNKLESIDVHWKHIELESVDVGDGIYQNLVKAAHEVQERKDAKIVQHKRLQTIEAKVFGGPVERPIETDAKEALKSALDAVRNDLSNLQAQEAARRFFESFEREELEGNTRIQEQIDALRTWLRTPHNPLDDEAVWKHVIPVLPAVIIAAISGAMLYTGAQDAERWIILVVSIVAALGSLWRGKQLRDETAQRTRQRAEIQENVRQTGLQLSVWSQDHVTSVLKQTENALLQRNEAARIRQRRNEVQNAERDAAMRLTRAQNRLEEIAARTGIRSDMLTLEAAEVFYRTEAWFHAKLAYEDAASALSNAQNTHARYLETWDNWLRMHQLQEQAHRVGDDAIIRYARNQISSLNTLRREIEHAEAALTREQEHAAHADADMKSLQARLVQWFDSEASLAQAINQRDQRQKIVQELASVEQRYTRALHALEKNVHTLVDAHLIHAENAKQARPIHEDILQELRREDIECARERMAADAARLNALIGEVARLQERLKHARQGSALEDAYAAREQAEEQSAEQAERRGMSQLEELMLEWSVRQVEGAGASESLDDADRWLRRFTHGRFGLRLSMEGGLVGYDVEAGEDRCLSELSDATRVQALLAARLVAIKEAEGDGEPLPIVLDEVFSTTDNERFEAIAEALSELVRNGRQIIYLTADPGEYSRWDQLHARKDLTKAHVQWLADLEDDLQEETLPRIEIAEYQPTPAPKGRNAEEYARALKLQAPRMKQNAQEWPLLWLLPDALDAVHSAVTQRLVSVGQTLSLIQSLGDEQIWRETEHSPAELSARVQRRVNMLQAVQKRWSRGVSQAFRWQDVENSGEVTDAFRERMQALYDQHRHDPETFVNAVGDLPRFQRAKTAALREYFLEQGILAQQTPATSTELRDCALAATDRNALTPEDVAWLESVLASILS